MIDQQRIQRALAQATDTRQVAIGPGMVAESGAFFAQAFPGKQPVVVADEITFGVAGEAVQASLEAGERPPLPPFIFPGTPTLYAGYERVTELAAALADHDAIPVAVGAGSLNDIAKLAAHQAGRLYMAVATAASMDGYTASGASITKDGFKQTFACPAPAVVLADTVILAAAPLAMTASGYGDLLGKITGGADWILADALGLEPIEPWSWSLVQDSLRDWLAHPERLAQGDEASFGALIEGLVLVGLAMQSYGNSRPASGSEHLLSHLWEMEAVSRHAAGDRAGDHPMISHGFKVGVGSVAITAFYEHLLALDLTQLDVDALCRAWPDEAALAASVRAAHPAGVLAERAVEESLAKHPSPAALAERLHRVRSIWPDLRARLTAQLLPAGEMRARLAALSAPTEVTQIGLTPAHLRQSYPRARQIRRRYTVLDLAVEAGVMQDSCGMAE